MSLDFSHLDRAACVRQFGRWEGPLWKHRYDLARYSRVIERTHPTIIIETGTNTGHSARWFASHVTQGVQHVITIDTEAHRWQYGSTPVRTHAPIHRLTGSSTDPDIVAGVEALIETLGGDEPRVMVSLDSDHSAGHVAEEIAHYAPLVTAGCDLVIEDGVLAWLPEEVQRDHGILGKYEGTVLDAIEAMRPALEVDFEIDPVEARFTATMHPAGWWRRR